MKLQTPVNKLLTRVLYSRRKQELWQIGSFCTFLNSSCNLLVYFLTIRSFSNFLRGRWAMLRAHWAKYLSRLRRLASQSTSSSGSLASRTLPTQPTENHRGANCLTRQPTDPQIDAAVGRAE